MISAQLKKKPLNQRYSRNGGGRNRGTARLAGRATAAVTVPLGRAASYTPTISRLGVRRHKHLLSKNRVAGYNTLELSSELTHPNFVHARETSQVDVHKHLEFATRPGPNNGTL